MDYAAGLLYLSQLRRLGIVPGTERLAQVLRRLGDPQAQIPAIHLAGTNGKGSTAAFAAHLLVAAAHQLSAQSGAAMPRVGLYTSPHLCRVRERVRISPSQPAAAGLTLDECSESDFARALSAVRAASEAEPAVELTFFEVLTAVAFICFAEAGVQAAVIETGLGGRLDATRLCQAQVTVVTGIGLDHTELLGDTLPKIAAEKAGIFRPGVPALIACEDAAARAVLCQVAAQRGAPLALLADDVRADDERGGAAFRRIPSLTEDQALRLPLAGGHQRRNAALALAAVACWPGPLGQVVSDPAVQARGLAQTRWPGRLERLWPQPELDEAVLRARLDLPTDVALPEVWLDGAHNGQGAALLAEFVDGLPAAAGLCVLFGMVRDKALPDLLGPLLRAQRVILTEPPSPRALPALELASALAALPATGLGTSALGVEAQPAAALRRAVVETPCRGRLLIYGSLFLVGAVRALWFGEPCDVVALSDPGPRRA